MHETYGGVDGVDGQPVDSCADPATSQPTPASPTATHNHCPDSGSASSWEDLARLDRRLPPA